MSETSWLAALVDLRDRRGRPSTRTIASRAPGISHVTVAEIFRGVRHPRLGTLLKIVQALDGDADDFTRLWRIAYDHTDPSTSLPPVPMSQRRMFQDILQELQEIRRLLEDRPNTPGKDGHAAAE